MIQRMAIVWGVADLARAIDFWSAALDYKLKYPPSEDWAILIPKQGEGTQFSLNRVSSPKARRHHLDLFSTSVEEDIVRLLALGAKRVDWRYEEGADYTVLEDPDGNRFCLIEYPDGNTGPAVE